MQWPKEKGQTIINKTLEIEQRGPHQKPGVNPNASEE
jgi:hypothetical protein